MKVSWLLFMLGLVMFLATVSVGILWYIQFYQQCGGYLERAANANTVILASEQLGKALNYIEREELTDGYTSVIYRTPDEDIGYWYNNLLAAKNELDSLPTEATPLEKTNVLMKLRETLTDSGQQGKSELVCPAGISRYPYNGLIAIMIWFSLLLATVFGITIISE